MQEGYISMASGGCDRSELPTLEALKKEEVIQQLKEWEEQKWSNAMLISLINYLHHVFFC